MSEAVQQVPQVREIGRHQNRHLEKSLIHNDLFVPLTILDFEESSKKSSVAAHLNTAIRAQESLLAGGDKVCGPWHTRIMLDRSRKRLNDPARLSKLAIDTSTGDAEEAPSSSTSTKNPAAVALGRLGGQKGGAARAASLSAAQRRRIAKAAAAARWHKK